MLIIDPSTTSPLNSYRILVGSVVPRPIAFVSTISQDGVYNLAPFSFFNTVCAEPPIVSFCPGMRTPPKDTLANIRATGEFVVNIVGEDIAKKMNLCSGDYPPDGDEFTISGLTSLSSERVRPPRVAESRVHMECTLHQIIEVSMRSRGATMVLGEVVCFHVDDEIIDEFRIDPDKLGAIGRTGGIGYSRTSDRFDMQRPRA